jgi:hypothetical protein
MYNSHDFPSCKTFKSAELTNAPSTVTGRPPEWGVGGTGNTYEYTYWSNNYWHLPVFDGRFLYDFSLGFFKYVHVRQFFGGTGAIKREKKEKRGKEGGNGKCYSK